MAPFRYYIPFNGITSAEKNRVSPNDCFWHDQDPAPPRPIKEFSYVPVLKKEMRKDNGESDDEFFDAKEGLQKGNEEGEKRNIDNGN
jgi:hypothetical protein